jgi:protein-disulfide isomerase
MHIPKPLELAAMLLWCTWLLFGCRSYAPKAATAAPSNSSVAVSDVRSSKCAHVAQAICDTAGQKSSECRATKYTLPLLSPKACTALLAEENDIVARVRAIRRPCLTLVERLCRDLGSDTEFCEVVQAQTAAFTVERCATMLGRYDELLNTLRGIAQGQGVLTSPEQSLLAAGDRPSFGPLDAKVVVVEFSDFQCPFCRGAARTVAAIQMQFARQVRFVFRQFPLTSHPNAHLAAEAALAANAQGKFWQFHDALFANQKALSRRDLETYAAAVGLDVTAFRQSLDEHRYASAVAEDVAIGTQLHVNGTPTLFINGRRVSNPSDTPGVLRAVREALINESAPSQQEQVLLAPTDSQPLPSINVRVF